MIEKITIARPYAEAVFSKAMDDGKLNEWSDMLNLLAKIISDRAMENIINHPRLADNGLYEFIIDMCGDKLDDFGRNFVKILIDAGRIHLAREIVFLFEQKRSVFAGSCHVELVSAYPLDDDQRQAISDAIEKRVGKQVEIETNVNKDIIGGVVIRIEDAVVDMSLRGHLEKLNNVIAQ